MNQTKNVTETQLNLTAASITNEVSAYGAVQVLHLFQPDDRTSLVLKNFRKGDIIDGLILTDKFDDGSIDVHVNRARFEVVCCFTGDSRKTESVTLILLDMDKVVRLSTVG